MDQVLIKLLDDACGPNDVLFSIGRNTKFIYQDNALIMHYESESGKVFDHPLLTVEQLVEGFEASDEDWTDKYLPLLMAIETAIDARYMEKKDINDKTVLAIVERLLNRPDIWLNDELTNSIQANMRLVLSTTKYSRKEVIGCLKKVHRSVKRHHSVDGPTAYLDFIRRGFAKVSKRSP